MSLELRFHDGALDELRSAAHWYDAKRAGLGSEFLEALDVALKRITSSPNQGGRLPGADPRSPFRRILLARFPYVVVFVEVEDAIRVLAVMHAKRRPGYWLGRVPP